MLCVLPILFTTEGFDPPQASNGYTDAIFLGFTMCVSLDKPEQESATTPKAYASTLSYSPSGGLASHCRSKNETDQMDNAMSSCIPNAKSPPGTFWYCKDHKKSNFMLKCHEHAHRHALFCTWVIETWAFYKVDTIQLKRSSTGFIGITRLDLQRCNC